jgi:uncharacterized protein YjiK
MNLIERPNLISLLILAGVVLIAGGYGLITYTQGPELEHYDVDENHYFPFDFERPVMVAKLPDELKEISGLADWDGRDQLIGVQDEDGVIFVIDAWSGQVLSEFKFGKDRDYEGLARVDSTIYVLERDGDIHRIDYKAGQLTYDAKKLETDFSYRNDTEGICYDERTNSLLIVPKEQELDPGEENYRRGIYGYELAAGKLDAQPRFYLDEFAIGQIIYGQRKPYRVKPSGVAVDPLTGDVYVIASVGNIMVVIDRESDVKQIELLKEKTFRQPEGITFNAAGDLFISSEGRGGKAVVVTFRRQTTGDKSNKNNE